MIETKDKANEILEYCYLYLKNPLDLRTEFDKFKKTKIYKEMTEEITFLIDTD